MLVLSCQVKIPHEYTKSTLIPHRSSTRSAFLIEEPGRIICYWNKHKHKQKVRLTARRKPEKTTTSSFDVRALSHDKIFYELIEHSNQYDLSVICMQEHRVYHPNSEKKFEMLAKGWVLVTSSAEKNDQHASMGGVDVLVSLHAVSLVLLIISPNHIFPSYQWLIIEPKSTQGTYNSRKDQCANTASSV